MKVAVIITESEMEELWKKTSFAYLFAHNPFELAYGDGEDYPYQCISIDDQWNPKTLKFEPVNRLPSSYFYNGMDRIYKIEMQQAIIEWIAEGYIPYTYLVMVQRDY